MQDQVNSMNPNAHGLSGSGPRPTLPHRGPVQHTTVNVQGPIQVLLPKGTPEKHAQLIIKKLTDTARTAMRTTGDAGTAMVGFSRFEVGQPAIG